MDLHVNRAVPTRIAVSIVVGVSLFFMCFILWKAYGVIRDLDALAQESAAQTEAIMSELKDR